MMIDPRCAVTNGLRAKKVQKKAIKFVFKLFLIKF